MSTLSEAVEAAKVAVQRAIDASDMDLNMWDACAENGVPQLAEDRHTRLKAALALLDPPPAERVEP